MIRRFFKRVFNQSDPLDYSDVSNADWAPVLEINSRQDVSAWLMHDDPSPAHTRRRKTSLGRKFLPPIPCAQLADEDFEMVEEHTEEILDEETPEPVLISPPATTAPKSAGHAPKNAGHAPKNASHAPKSAGHAPKSAAPKNTGASKSSAEVSGSQSSAAPKVLASMAEHLTDEELRILLKQIR